MAVLIEADLHEEGNDSLRCLDYDQRIVQCYIVSHTREEPSSVEEAVRRSEHQAMQEDDRQVRK